MKLLKYVMTTDSGLAPNPYFDVCSLALCTPNHMNAQLEFGDWVVAHASKDTGHRLVYAMRLTRILDMPDYFAAFPNKRPDPYGSREQQCGDNLYYRDGGRWARLPSAEHNTPESFFHDQNRMVYLAEGADNFWYFGAASTLPALDGFADQFPWLIKDRQGFSYVRDEKCIGEFGKWLRALGHRGLIGQPRDQVETGANRYLITIDPMPQWKELDDPVACSKSVVTATREDIPVHVQRRGQGCALR